MLIIQDFALKIIFLIIIFILFLIIIIFTLFLIIIFPSLSFSLTTPFPSRCPRRRHLRRAPHRPPRVISAARGVVPRGRDRNPRRRSLRTGPFGRGRRPHAAPGRPETEAAAGLRLRRQRAAAAPSAAVEQEAHGRLGGCWD